MSQSIISLPISRLTSPLTLRDGVAEQLRTAIISGSLQPGAVLTETGLATQLGVSTTPVREALLDLAAEGLVESQTHRLRRVTPIHLPATLGLLQVQGALWRMGYIWGFAHIGPKELTRLDAALRSYAAALRTGDTLGAIRSAQDFHTVFIEASGNSELLRVTLDRRSLIARFILLRGAKTVSPSGLAQHRAMLASFRRGDTADILARLDQLSTKLIALAQHDPE
ncbi:MAG: GntR family transcriptional regulator [Janthinobacterium lividum]